MSDGAHRLVVETGGTELFLIGTLLETVTGVSKEKLGDRRNRARQSRGAMRGSSVPSLRCSVKGSPCLLVGERAERGQEQKQTGRKVDGMRDM